MKYILSIDGGGIRGIIPLYFLMYLEQDLLLKKNKTIYDIFDMYSGTSVGAIIIASIVYGPEGSGPIKISSLISTMYTKENFKKIFTKYPSILKYVLLRPKYTGKFKEKLIKDFLGNTKITDTEKQVMIPVYDVSEQKSKFYKSYSTKYRHKSEKSCILFGDNCEGFPEESYNINNSKLLLSSVVDASSSPPIYFPSVEYDSDGDGDGDDDGGDGDMDEDNYKKTESVKRTGIDGAIFCNNSSDSLYADALRLYPDDNITIISIGTGAKEYKHRHKETKKWGPIQWVNSGIADIILSSNEVVADYKTKHFSEALGHKYIRIQEPIDIQLDDTSKIDDLIKIAGEWYSKYREQLLKLL